MGYRRFTDTEGHTWEVRDTSRSDWDFEPVAGNPMKRETVRAPGYESDPFELSQGELQRMLDAVPTRSRPKPSPFID